MKTGTLWYKLLIVSSIFYGGIFLFKIFTFSTNEDEQDQSFQTQFENNYNIYALTIPTQLSFAGEDVPINRSDVKESFDRELLVNTYWQSQTMLFIKRSHKWFPVIEPILKENGVPDDFKYLALIESGLTQIISPAGATGFWQFLKPAAREYGLEVNNEIDERYHVEKATKAACLYIKDAYQKFNGSWTLAAASYNVGRAGVQKQLDRQKTDNYYDLVLNEETARYLFRILAAKEILSNPIKYGFYFRRKDLYSREATKAIQIDSSVTDLANFAINIGITYKSLKDYNPWLRQNFVTNKNKKQYTIHLPLEANVPDSMIIAN